MAIMEPASTKHTLEIHEFYKRHRVRSFTIVIIFQLVSVGVLAGALLVSEVFHVQAPLFWVVLGVALAVNLSVNIIAMSVIVEPMRAISLALSHIAGEKSPYSPPNPNAKQYDHDGTKTMLDLIYKLTYEKDNSAAAHSRASETDGVLEDALSQTEASIVVFDTDDDILYASPSAPVKTNPKGVQSLDLMFDSGDVSFEYWLQDCKNNKVDSEKLWTRIHTNPNSKSEPRIFDIAASYSRGSTTQIVLVLHDRTEQYAPDEKDLDFISFAAHELRGPVTVIRGYLDVLDDELADVLTSEQKILLGRLMVSSNRLSTYINNILNVSRYDKRHYHIELSEQRLFNMYDSIAHDMETRASTLGRVLAADIPHNLPTIAADANSITEVFSNLIDNAIKYSHEGGIIKVSAKTAGDFVEISISDDGIGMPDSVVQNLFHKFYRSHRSREQVAGSGIGLYLSKAIIESHGGTISVRSSENKGSTFTFALPLYSAVEEKLKAGDNGNNQHVIRTKQNWISNHNMYRG